MLFLSLAITQKSWAQSELIEAEYSKKLALDWLLLPKWMNNSVITWELTPNDVSKASVEMSHKILNWLYGLMYNLDNVEFID